MKILQLEPKKTKISVLVCCHNSAIRIIQCLSSIDSALTDISDAVEVIVIDNASTDNTSAIAKDIFRHLENATYSVITEPVPGLSHARAAGILAAKGEYICFIDDDNWASSAYFKAVIHTFNSMQKVGFFGCATRLPYGLSFPLEIASFAKGYAVGDLHHTSCQLSPGNSVWGAGLAVRSHIVKSFLEAGFSPVLTGRKGAVQLAGDDTEYCLMIAIAGWHGWYQCEPLIEHSIDPARMTVAKLEQMQKGFGASSSLIMRYSLFARGKKALAIDYFFLLTYPICFSDCLKQQSDIGLIGVT